MDPRRPDCPFEWSPPELCPWSEIYSFNEDFATLQGQLAVLEAVPPACVSRATQTVDEGPDDTVLLRFAVTLEEIVCGGSVDFEPEGISLIQLFNDLKLLLETNEIVVSSATCFT